MARAKKKTKIWSAVYSVFLTLYIIALLCAVCFALSKVWTYAVEYEASRPTNTMDAYIDSLNKNFWNSTMSDTIANMPHEVQTDDECREFVQGMLNGGIKYQRTVGGGSGEMVYNLSCENGVIGKVTIAEDKSYEDKVEFGMLPWKVVKDEFNFDGLYSSVTVTVPANYSVALNGVVLGPEYIIEDGIHLDMLDAYYDEYPSLPTKVTYRFENIIGRLEPVIYDADGNETVIDEALGDAQFITFADDATVERLTSFVTSFENLYRKYSSGAVGNYDKLLSYIIKDGDIDKRLQAAKDGLSWAHTNWVDIKSTTVDSVIQIDENTWIVRETTEISASTTQVLESTNTMELIITRRGNDDLRIIAMTGV